MLNLSKHANFDIQSTIIYYYNLLLLNANRINKEARCYNITQNIL